MGNVITMKDKLKKAMEHDNVMLWAENPYYQSEVTDITFEDVTDSNGIEVRMVSLKFDGLTGEHSPVMEDLNEWSHLITELSAKEKDLFRKKEEYTKRSEEIIAITDFKEVYGKNNEKVRQQHVKDELHDEYMTIRELEFRIDYIMRRVSFLKHLIHTKNIMAEVKD